MSLEAVIVVRPTKMDGLEMVALAELQVDKLKC